MGIEDWRLDMDPPGVLCKDCARYRNMRPEYPMAPRPEIPDACIKKTTTDVVTGAEAREYADATEKNKDGMCDEFEQKQRTRARTRRPHWFCWFLQLRGKCTGCS